MRKVTHHTVSEIWMMKICVVFDRSRKNFIEPIVKWYSNNRTIQDDLFSIFDFATQVCYINGYKKNVSLKIH